VGAIFLGMAADEGCNSSAEDRHRVGSENTRDLCTPGENQLLAGLKNPNGRSGGRIWNSGICSLAVISEPSTQADSRVFSDVMHRLSAVSDGGGDSAEMPSSATRASCAFAVHWGASDPESRHRAELR